MKAPHILAFAATLGVLHAADVSFTLAKPGNVSAANYDSQGRLLRSLLHGKPIRQVTIALRWMDLMPVAVRCRPPWRYQAQTDHSVESHES